MIPHAISPAISRTIHHAPCRSAPAARNVRPPPTTTRNSTFPATESAALCRFFISPPIARSIPMAERSISVRLRADVSQYMASLKTASRETARFSDRLMSRAESAGAAFTAVGSSLTRFGMATAGALALSTKAAIDWESAWVGVQKTVDGSASEMAALEGELREMAKTLPIAHEEIAGVAAAAGQLGVKREDIASFTRTMIDLGQSTNLAAEEAATAIARFSNIMGTAHDHVDRVGSALVALGNNSATTEAEIMSMASRMAGAGALIGATESDVLAMAAALSSI